MDISMVKQSCIDDIELLKKHSKGQTKKYDLSIALDRSVRQRRRMIERIEQLWKIVEANREPQ